MSAKENNQWWKLRSKHGRDKIISDPEVLKEAAYDYFQKTYERTDWDEPHWVGKDGHSVTRPHRPPFTIVGLCTFLGISYQTWRNYKRDSEKDNKDFFEVITHVEEIIDTNQFEGATVGAFNANIISRKLGLTDKQQHEIIKEQPLFTDAE